MSGVRRRDNDLDQLIVIPERNFVAVNQTRLLFPRRNFIQCLKIKRAFPVVFIPVARVTSFKFLVSVKNRTPHEMLVCFHRELKKKKKAPRLAIRPKHCTFQHTTSIC